MKKIPSSARNFYFAYFRIEPKNYNERITFFEKHFHALELLSSFDKLELELDYINCLFEIGKYERYLDKVDRKIVLIIEENIDTFQGKNIYNDLLFKKAACLFNTGNLDNAVHIAKELIKIDQNETLYRNFLRKCLRVKHIAEKQRMKSTALFLLIFIVFVLAIEILVIRIFFPSLSTTFEIIRNVAFGIAILLVIWQEAIFRNKYRSLVNELLSSRK